MIATALDTFTRAYVECALWSSMDDNETPLDANYGADDIAPDTLQTMIAECEQFQQQNRRIIAADLSRGVPFLVACATIMGRGFGTGTTRLVSVAS